MTDRPFTHPNFGREVRIEQFGREVHLIFVAGSDRQADSLVDTLLRSSVPAPPSTRPSVRRPDMTPYEALKATGHSPAKAAEIILDAKRGDWFSQQWLKAVSDSDGRAAIRRSIIRALPLSDLTPAPEE